ncbi:MAG: hypothetical protein K2G58_04860, partial [Alistipes sp.]|nr:hypothetical protein [Alistipes sp.]
ANSLIGEPAAVFMSNTLDDDRFREVFTVNNLDTIQTQASPKLMIRRVRFVITLEDFSASACRGIFGGVAASLKCATCQCLPTSAHVSFQTEVDPRNPNVFRASFNVFDLITPDEQTHMLELTLTIDGVDRTTSVDLSGDVKRELDKGEFTYEMPLNLNVKVTHTIDGDIYASVEGWDNSGTGSGTGSY